MLNSNIHPQIRAEFNPHTLDQAECIKLAAIDLININGKHISVIAEDLQTIKDEEKRHVGLSWVKTAYKITLLVGLGLALAGAVCAILISKREKLSDLFVPLSLTMGSVLLWLPNSILKTISKNRKEKANEHVLERFRKKYLTELPLLIQHCSLSRMAAETDICLFQMSLASSKLNSIPEDTFRSCSDCLDQAAKQMEEKEKIAKKYPKLFKYLDRHFATLSPN